MTFSKADKRKDSPRPLNRCGSYAAPGRDARWRGIAEKRINSLRVHEARR